MRRQELQIDNILNFIMRGAAMLMIIWWGSMMIGYVLCFSCGFNWPIDCEENVSIFYLKNDINKYCVNDRSAIL